MTRSHASLPRSGFTLIEMIIVVTIVAMLMGLGIPGIAMAIKQGDQNSTVNIISTMHRQLRKMAMDGEMQSRVAGGFAEERKIYYNYRLYIRGNDVAFARVQKPPREMPLYSSLPERVEPYEIGKSFTYKDAPDDKKPKRPPTIALIDTLHTGGESFTESIATIPFRFEDFRPWTFRFVNQLTPLNQRSWFFSPRNKLYGISGGGGGSEGSPHDKIDQWSEELVIEYEAKTGCVKYHNCPAKVQLTLRHGDGRTTIMTFHPTGVLNVAAG